jgi:hypothetical protein
LIDVSFVHVNFHREPYKNLKAIEEYSGFLARESVRDGKYDFVMIEELRLSSLKTTQYIFNVRLTCVGI